MKGKILKVFCCLIVLFSLCGCGKKENNNEEKDTVFTMTFWHNDTALSQSLLTERDSD